MTKPIVLTEEEREAVRTLLDRSGTLRLIDLITGRTHGEAQHIAMHNTIENLLARSGGEGEGDEDI